MSHAKKPTRRGLKKATMKLSKEEKSDLTIRSSPPPAPEPGYVVGPCAHRPGQHCRSLLCKRLHSGPTAKDIELARLKNEKELMRRELAELREFKSTIAKHNTHT